MTTQQPRSRGKTVVTDGQDGRTGRTKTNRAAARTPKKDGRTRDELRALYGASAHRIVRAYEARRLSLGLPPGDVRPLAGQAMRLLDLERVSKVTGKSEHVWSFDALYCAAWEFAPTNRFTGYFQEWASEFLTAIDAEEYEERKAEAGIAPDPRLAVMMPSLSMARPASPSPQGRSGAQILSNGIRHAS